MLGKSVDDPGAYFDRVDEDVEWDLRDTTSPMAGVYHGRDEVRELYRRWAGAFSDWHFHIDRLIDAGDLVVAKDGKIVRFRSFSTREDALRAAGLAP